jgi:ribosome maturation protein Sdo1
MTDKDKLIIVDKVIRDAMDTAIKLQMQDGNSRKEQWQYEGRYRAVAEIQRNISYLICEACGNGSLLD